MSYSARQRHCLEAMGLVAWERRDKLVAAPVEARAAGIAPVPASAPTSDAASAATPPRELDKLAHWLPEAPLATFTHRERTLTRVGRGDAPLLVIVERSPGEPAHLPLQGADDALFENMLRAIGLTRQDTCQCVLSEEPDPDAETLAPLFQRAHKASLVLVQDLDPDLSETQCRLPDTATGRPAWCLPHPALLADSPVRKRQAWHVLQAIGQVLGAQP